MQQYLDMLDRVLTHGKKRATDTQGIGNIAVLGHEMRFRPAEGFPLITTKKINFRFVVGELLWFLRGDTRIDFLRENKIPIWDSWATKEVTAKYGLNEGDVGRIYPAQWIHWKTTTGGEINQIAELVKELTTFPDSKRLKVIAWNPENLDVPVAPCHGDFKCFVVDGELSLCMTQRSADVPIGVPYNIASYSLLLLMLAQVTGLRPGEYVHYTIDTHIYLNQIELVKEQLKRKPRSLPTVRLDPTVTDIFKFNFEHFKLEGYDPDLPIKYPVGV